MSSSCATLGSRRLGDDPHLRQSEVPPRLVRHLERKAADPVPDVPRRHEATEPAARRASEVQGEKVSEVTISQVLPVRLYYWLQEHGYTPAFNNTYCSFHKPCWCEAKSLDSESNDIGVLHGTQPPKWFHPYRRLVGIIYIRPEMPRFEINLVGDDAPASLFKRSLEELASALEVDIHAIQQTTANLLEETSAPKGHSQG